MRLKLVPSQTNFDFFRSARFTFGASVLAMVASVVLFLVVGLNYGIDFRGGTTIRTDSAVAVDVAAYRAALEPLNLGDVSISQVVDPTRPDKNVAQVRIQAQEGAESVTNAVILAVKHALGTTTGGAVFLDVQRFRAARGRAGDPRRVPAGVRAGDAAGRDRGRQGPDPGGLWCLPLGGGRL